MTSKELSEVGKYAQLTPDNEEDDESEKNGEDRETFHLMMSILHNNGVKVLKRKERNVSLSNFSFFANVTSTANEAHMNQTVDLLLFFCTE